MSTTTPSLEERVAVLERQVEKLLAAQADGNQQKDWRRTLGMFTGDEVMRAIDEEALRYREEDRCRFKEEYDAAQAEAK
jgi:hypothetical protein